MFLMQGSLCKEHTVSFFLNFLKGKKKTSHVNCLFNKVTAMASWIKVIWNVWRVGKRQGEDADREIFICLLSTPLQGWLVIVFLLPVY